MDRARLKELIDKYDSENQIGVTVTGYNSGVELIEAVRKGNRVDIIFWTSTWILWMD